MSAKWAKGTGGPAGDEAQNLITHVDTTGVQAVLSTVVVRRLTPTECERLQGFPDGYTAFDAHGKPLSDGARYRLIGNSVPVPTLEWVAKGIAAVHRGLDVDALRNDGGGQTKPRRATR